MLFTFAALAIGLGLFAMLTMAFSVYARAHFLLLAMVLVPLGLFFGLIRLPGIFHWAMIPIAIAVIFVAMIPLKCLRCRTSIFAKGSPPNESDWSPSFSDLIVQQKCPECGVDRNKKYGKR